MIMWGVINPLLITFRALFIRLYSEEYKGWDLGIDSIILESLCYCIMYFIYIFYIGAFDLYELLWGQLAAVFLIITK